MEKKNLTMVEQLRKHINEIGEDAFRQEVFEFNCKWHNIDPNDKYAKRKLKRKQRWDSFIHTTLPKLYKNIELMLAMGWPFALGAELNKTNPSWFLVIVATIFALLSGHRIWKYIKNNQYE